MFVLLGFFLLGLGGRLRGRRGGEQFQRTPRSTPRSLKKQYQAAGLAQWDRQGPLLYIGDALVFVPGLGIDARQWAAEDEAQVTLRWELLPLSR